jgi:hypothetical protein
MDLTNLIGDTPTAYGCGGFFFLASEESPPAHIGTPGRRRYSSLIRMGGVGLGQLKHCRQLPKPAQRHAGFAGRPGDGINGGRPF